MAQEVERLSYNWNIGGLIPDPCCQHVQEVSLCKILNPNPCLRHSIHCVSVCVAGYCSQLAGGTLDGSLCL